MAFTVPSSDREAKVRDGQMVLQPCFEMLGTPLFEATFVVLDLETTGLAPATDRITEIGAVKVRGGEVQGEFQTLVHPGRPIPAAITALTGISDAMVAGAPRIEGVLALLLEFVGDAALVAHNAGFDTGFLNAELERHGFPRLQQPVIDTRGLARRLVRTEVRDLRLTTLARHLRSRTLPEHRALIDARATVDVLHGLLERAGPLGATTLEDVADLTRSTSEPAFRRMSLVRDAPRRPGVYRFLDARGEVLYVGKAGDLRTRLRRYFGQDPRRRIADLVRETTAVTWDVTPTPLAAEVAEVRAIQASRPRYNRRSKHPERAVWVKLTRERFPRLSIVGKVTADGAHYLGPLPSRRTATTFVEAIHDVLPLRQCTMRLRVAQDHAPCVLKDLGRCGAPCDGTQTAEDYRAVAGRYVAAVDEDPTPVLDALRGRMVTLAGARRYERAAAARRRLHAVTHALAEARATTDLAALEEACAARPRNGAWEVALVRWGRLVASAVATSVSPEAVMTAIGGAAAAGATPASPEAVAATTGGAAARTLPTDKLETAPAIPACDVEELRLVRTWLDAPGVRVVWTRGAWHEPVAGGAALAGALGEARRLARQLRHDRHLLTGAKVARRGAEPAAHAGGGGSARR